METIMKVKEVMHKGVEWREPDTSVAELARVMAAEDIGAIPIGENDRLVGMVTDRDIAIRAFKNADASNKTARDVMTEGVIYCMENENIEDAIRLMEQKEIRRLPVINDNKRMVGILSLGDVSHAVNQSLSGELIRAVSDHHDEPILLAS